MDAGKAARTLNSDRRQEALGGLLRTYWKPIYCYLRHKGCDNEKAKDLTQGFFHQIILGRGLIEHADRAKGKFRTFLLSALNRYIVSEHRMESAQKRSPAEKMVVLDAMESPDMAAVSDAATPDQAFTYAWASALLDTVLAQVKEACRSAGQEAHWSVFDERIIRPIRENAEPPSLEEICDRHGISDEDKASNMLVTVKRRFQRALREQVRKLVGEDGDVDAEILDIMKILSEGGAGP